MTKYALPDLPYDYGALEPHISAKIMQLHHDKHHKTYVDGANQTLEALTEARDKGDFARIAALEHQLAFHVSGHVLHSIFWKNLSPDGGGNPSGDETLSHSFDFIEIDAASNRGIDDVRSIINQAEVRPARDRYKIFLLDEAHQITDAAFNAILNPG